MLKNYTPHDVHICNSDGNVVLTLPSVGVARVAAKTVQVDELVMPGTTVPVMEEQLGAVEGLPDPETGVHFIVSRMVAAASGHRNDLLVPGELVRDARGVIIGCKTLVRP